MKQERKLLGTFQNSLTFIYILILGGILCGIVLTQWMHLSEGSSLDAMLLTVNQSVEQYTYFTNQFIIGIMFVVFIFFLGSSVLGIPAIAFFLFTRGVQIGFSCVLFVSTYQLKGIIGIVLTLLPQVIFDVIAIIIIAVFSIECSTSLLYAFINGQKVNLKRTLNKGLNHLLIAFIFVLITAYLKATVILKLIQLFNLI